MDPTGNLILMALLGGTLIGVALGAFTLLTGRVMTGSGMIGSLLGGAEGVAATSIAFIGGLAAAPVIVMGLGVERPDVMEPGLALLVIGGVLVGASARIGGASLGAVMTGFARRSPGAVPLLLIMLGGATLGGVLQRVFAGGLSL